MKKILILLSMILVVTGCSINRFDNQDIDVIIDTILKEDTKLNNVVLEGYKYYIPHGVTLVEKHDYNQVLEYNNNNYYLYIDIISYYYKEEVNHKYDYDLYLSKNLSYNNKTGYIDIRGNGDNYYIDAYYNYAKVEAYVKKEDLKDSIINICYVLNSLKFNNKVIESMVGENKLDLSSEGFSLFDKKKDTSSFLEYVKEYDKYYDVDGELPTDDKIKINESKD